MLPASLAQMVNTLRSDVDSVHDELRHELFEAARLRQANDRTVFDVMDRLKSTLSQRFMAWFRDGQFAEALEAIGQAPKEVEVSKVKFPTGT